MADEAVNAIGREENVDEAVEMKPALKTRVVEVELPAATGVNGKVPPPPHAEPVVITLPDEI